MMHRRSLLTMLGIGALAPVLSTLPARAKPITTPMSAVAAEFKDPLYAIAFTEGSRGERYRHWMPATAGVVRGGKLVITFIASFTGTIRSVEIARGDINLVTMYRDAFDTPNWVKGSTIQVTIEATSNPSEET